MAKYMLKARVTQYDRPNLQYQRNRPLTGNHFPEGDTIGNALLDALHDQLPNSLERIYGIDARVEILRVQYSSWDIWLQVIVSGVFGLVTSTQTLRHIEEQVRALIESVGPSFNARLGTQIEVLSQGNGFPSGRLGLSKWAGMLLLANAVISIAALVFAVGAAKRTVDFVTEESRSYGKLIVNTTEPQTEIFIDGKYVGGSVEASLPPGEHTVEVFSERPRPWKRQVLITKNGVVTISTLTALAPPQLTRRKGMDDQ